MPRRSLHHHISDFSTLQKKKKTKNKEEKTGNKGKADSAIFSNMLVFFFFFTTLAAHSDFAFSLFSRPSLFGSRLSLFPFFFLASFSLSFFFLPFCYNFQSFT